MSNILDNLNKFLQTENGQKLKELLKIIFAEPKPPVWIMKDYPKK